MPNDKEQEEAFLNACKKNHAEEATLLWNQVNSKQQILFLERAYSTMTITNDHALTQYYLARITPLERSRHQWVLNEPAVLSLNEARSVLEKILKEYSYLDQNHLGSIEKFFNEQMKGISAKIELFEMYFKEMGFSELSVKKPLPMLSKFFVRPRSEDEFLSHEGETFKRIQHKALEEVKRELDSLIDPQEKIALLGKCQKTTLFRGVDKITELTQQLITASYENGLR